MNLAIVIVNYNMGTLILRCLDSLLFLLRDKKVKIVIVDNCSTDDSRAIIDAFILKTQFEERISLFSSPLNGGFAYGNNRGVEFILKDHPDTEFFWFLNPDTYFKSGDIEKIRDIFLADDRVGIVGTLQTSSVSNQWVCSCFNFPLPVSELLRGSQLGFFYRYLTKATIPIKPSEEIKECDWVSGASFFVRRELVDRIGFMDESYFLYFEEVDFCYRAKSAGWKVVCAPYVDVVHEDKSSTGVVSGSLDRPAFWYDSRRCFYYKCYGFWGVALADVCWCIGRASFLARYYCGLQSDTSLPSTNHTKALIWGDIKAALTYCHGKVFNDYKKTG